MTDDNINSPRHYTTGKIEVFDFITDQKMGYIEGNIIKYLCRYKHKGTPLCDVKKAQWYMDKLVEQMERLSVE